MAVDGVSLEADNRGPGAGGNVGESSDLHVLEGHSSLSEAPLLANPVIKWEQLLGSASVNLYESGSHPLTALLASRSAICHLMRLATPWTNLLLVTGSGGTL